MPKVIQVIENLEEIGDIEDESLRVVRKYYSLDGRDLATSDNLALELKERKIKKLGKSWMTLTKALENRDEELLRAYKEIGTLKDKQERLEMDIEFCRKG